MVEQDSFELRCRACVADLSEREGWGLSETQIAAYAERIVSQAPATPLAIPLELVVRYFHRDHALYDALRDEDSPQHAPGWAWVQREITRTAQIKGLGWSRDRSVELDDLVQTVQAEVARALPDYRFASSLRTWLQSVTVRRLRRFHRDSLAAKRAVVPEPLEAASEQAFEWNELEHELMAGALLEEIARVLRAAGDPRYVTIVRLALVDDHTSQEIGERLRLHPSRVRALLKLARTHLREDTALRAWYLGDLDGGAQQMV